MAEQFDLGFMEKPKKDEEMDLKKFIPDSTYFSNFPIGESLSNISKSLKESPTHCLVLTAETAAGKSTVLPLWLLNEFEGKILMSEPRRLAVLGVANRLAEQLNEKCGETIGYKIHLDSKESSKTRFEVVTEGILVRNLQADEILEKYNLVIIDEFHERSVNTDLALAFLKEALELRDDLYVIIMSATMDTKKIAAYLGEGTPELKIPGRQFPVEVIYDEKSEPWDAVKKALNSGEKGNILVFLPGIGDIRRCQEKIAEFLDFSEVELHILHSSISLEDQKKVLKNDEGCKQKIILSSAIAETSLTVPGVKLVIDSGLARVNRLNISTGMENLETEVESEFSAEQRKGRAGRESCGKCVRLWNSFDLRKKDFEPEILRSDLSNLVLECADRGIYDLEKISWLDSPGKGNWQSSVKLLKLLGLLENDNHISQKGKWALKLGISPRLAAIVLDGVSNNLDYKDLILKYSTFENSGKEIQNKFLQDLNKRLSDTNLNLLKESCEKITDKRLLILCGFPERLAKKIKDSDDEYQFFSGRKAALANKNSTNSDWICAPEVMAGKTQGKIFEFEEIPADLIEKWIENKVEIYEKVYFEKGKLEKRKIKAFGKIELLSQKMVTSQEDYKLAWVSEIKEKGFDVLPSSEKIEKFLVRVKFSYQQEGKIFDEKMLAESCEEWLCPFINDSVLTSDSVYEALRWYLNGQKIDEEIPEVIKLTNGSKCKVTYSLQNSPDDKTKQVIRPVIEVIIQRVFGCFETPEICDMKVLLKLLSPASRPLQITDDLAGFWNGAWIEICKEMKGRYPKHNWDYRICPE